MDSLESLVDVKRSVFDWDDLQVFFAVARTGSMSAAAAALGIQQPTVSKRIQQLESRLGTKLIERRAGGLVLTSAGHEAMDYVQTIQRSAVRLESRLGGKDKARTGEVTLQVSDGLATYWLARHLPKFLQANPGVELNLVREADRSAPLPTPDLSITFSTDKAMESTAHSLGRLHYMPFTSRRFIDTYGAPKNAHDALSYRFLKLEHYSSDGDLWKRRVETVDAYIQYGFRTDVSGTLLELLRNGGGIAMLPTYLAPIFEDELVLLDFDFKQDVHLWLKYMPESHRVGRNKCVGDWVKSIFRSADNPWFRDEFCHPSEFSKIEVISPQT
ncbi:MAG: LysR family transcriptional regulator [Rhizobiales bacterium]|nr:LysR family transcriptional regulator [Hyphomicrobiales bacterium]